MSIGIGSGLVTFPNQQTIFDYLNSYALTKIGGTFDFTKDIESRAPNRSQNIADYFANKTMSTDDICQNVREVLQDTIDRNDLVELAGAVNTLLQSPGRINLAKCHPNSEFTKSIKNIYSKITPSDPRSNDAFEIVVSSYKNALQDLLAKVTYTRRETAEGAWTKPVEDLTKKPNSTQTESVMSTQVGAGTITFPNQQEIINYINGHPLTKVGGLETEVVKSQAPNGTQKIANYFANQTMAFSSIGQNVRRVLTDENEKKELDTLTAAVSRFLVKCEEIDSNSNIKDSQFTASIKSIHSQLTEPNTGLEVVITLYEQLLHDLLKNATYTPPEHPEGRWTQQIAVVTGTQTKPGQTDLTKNYV